MDSIKKSKGSEILLLLEEGPKNVQQIQNGVGGSSTTIQERIEELTIDGLIDGQKLDRFPCTREIRLTDRGRVVVELIRKIDDSYKHTLPKQREKWILAVLHELNEVKGITRLEKLAFLLDKELNAVPTDNYYEFVKQKYGPYSPEIVMDMSELNNINLVEITWADVDIKKPKGDVKRTDFKLTELGKNVAKFEFEKLPKKTREAIVSLKKYNDMSLVELLNYVHTKYKEYSLE